MFSWKMIRSEKLSEKEIIDRFGDSLTTEQWKLLFERMYSKEEVEELIKDFYKEFCNGTGLEDLRDKFIKENLK